MRSIRVLSSVALLVVFPARADHVLPLDLAWEAPEGCPTAEDVSAQIRRLTRATARGRRRLVATARASRGEDGLWRLALETRLGGGQDTRELVGDSCEALAGSAAVVLAMRLDAYEEEEGPPRPSAPPPPPPAPRRTRPHSPARFSLGLAAAFDTSVLPGPAVGASLRGSIDDGRFHVGFSGTSFLPSESALAEGGGGTFRFHNAALAGGWDLLDSRVSIGPALGFEAGVITAESFDVRRDGRTTEAWLAALGGAQAAIGLGDRFRLIHEVWVVVPLRRPDFVIEGRGTVHQPPPASARVYLGFDGRF